MEITQYYLLKVSICISVLYAVYFCFLRTTTFFNLNRCYLLFTLIFCFTVPLIESPFRLIELEQQLTQYSVTEGFFRESEIDSEGQIVSMKHADYLAIVSFLYYIGLIFYGIRSVVAILKLSSLTWKTQKPKSGRIRILPTLGAVPFSFFNVIFMPHGQEENPMIVKHEEAHVVQYHWVDLLLAELATVVLWFNPFAYLYRKSIKEQHEFLADAYVINHGYDTKTYLETILQFISQEIPLGPVSHFHSNSLKTRIVMMTKQKSSTRRRLIYLLTIPALSAMFFAFSTTTESSHFNKEIIVVVDPAHGGSDAGSSSSTGLTEKEITLAVAKLIQDEGAKHGLKIFLTRSADETVSLKDRVAFAEKNNAELFISLHLSFDQDVTLSGAEFLIDSQSKKYQDSQKLSSMLMNNWRALDHPVAGSIKNSSAFVLKNDLTPSVIIALGYLSNEKDAEFINDKTNQKLVADRIVKSILNYF